MKLFFSPCAVRILENLLNVVVHRADQVTEWLNFLHLNTLKYNQTTTKYIKTKTTGKMMN
jgi:hypothetical protein